MNMDGGIKLSGGSIRSFSIPNTPELPSVAQENLLMVKNGSIRRAKPDNVWDVVPTKPIPPGQINYANGGSFTFTVPDGVTQISVFVIGAGGGGGRGGSNRGSSYYDQVGGAGGAGGESYENFLVVEPGETFTAIVGHGGSSDADGGNTIFRRDADNTVVTQASGGTAGEDSLGMFAIGDGGPGGTGTYKTGDAGDRGESSHYNGLSYGGSSGGGSQVGIIAGGGGNGGWPQSGGSPGDDGGIRIIWGEGRSFPTTNVQDV